MTTLSSEIFNLKPILGTKPQEDLLHQEVDIEEFRRICKHCLLYLAEEWLPMEQIAKLMHANLRLLARLRNSLEGNNFDIAKKHTKRCRLL